MESPPLEISCYHKGIPNGKMICSQSYPEGSKQTAKASEDVLPCVPTEFNLGNKVNGESFNCMSGEVQ